MDLSVIEQLCFSTVRIETTSYEGFSFSGTGFFFNLLWGTERNVYRR